MYDAVITILNIQIDTNIHIEECLMHCRKLRSVISFGILSNCSAVTLYPGLNFFFFKKKKKTGGYLSIGGALVYTVNLE